MQKGDWQVDLYFDGSGTPDGGLEVLVKITHWPTAQMLSGYVNKYEDDPKEVVQICKSDFCLPFPAAARLLSKVFCRYAPDLTADDGGITAWPDMFELIDDYLYGCNDDGPKVHALVQASIDQRASSPPWGPGVGDRRFSL
jgi:hypothetical protein